MMSRPPLALTGYVLAIASAVFAAEPIVIPEVYDPSPLIDIPGLRTVSRRSRIRWQRGSPILEG